MSDSEADQTPERAPADWLSGTSGIVAGVRATTRALAADAVADAVVLATGQGHRLARSARAWPRRRVLVLAVERTDMPNLLPQASAELARSHHEVELATTPVGGRGKYENLNALLEEHPPGGHDWVIALDDDVALPRGFLDNFVFLAERFGLRLAQPAHRHRSHAAWRVTRRRAGSVVRETAFVESGPLVAFHSDTFGMLLPFPPLRAGWGLDAHWSALVAQRGWRLGIVDATPVRHGLRLIATSYDRSAAIEEGRRFLAGKPYTPAAVSQRTLVTHRSWT